MSCFVQAFTDRTHTSVHHIRRCYHVRTCLDVRKSCLCKQFQSCVVFYIVSAENTAVSVGSVLTHAYVCNIVEIRKLFFCLTECSLYDSVFVVGTASDFILMIRNAEQHDIADSGFRQTLQFIWKTVHTVAELSFHRRDLLLNPLSFFYKQRVDERRFVNPRFPYHFTQSFTAAQSSWSLNQIHCCHSLFVFYLFNKCRQIVDRSFGCHICFHSIAVCCCFCLFADTCCCHI